MPVEGFKSMTVWTEDHEKAKELLKKLKLKSMAQLFSKLIEKYEEAELFEVAKT